MKRILFLPSYLGGGFGHISRCLILADELEERGWETGFALGGYHARRLKDEGRQVFILRRPYTPKADSSEGPAYTVFTDFNYQLVRDGFISSPVVKKCLAEQIKTVRRFQPDLLVSDSWPLASILAALEGLPLVQLVRTATHPSGPRLMWWQEPPNELRSPDPRPVFNPVLKEIGLPMIEKGEDLLHGDLYLVPSIPALDPLSEASDTYYVGPLAKPATDRSSLPEWAAELNPAKPLVYITLGGGAGPVGGPEFYTLLFDALSREDIQVVASTGSRITREDIPKPPANFRLETWVPGQAVIEMADLVVYPGGYGTTMELVRAGTPGLVIPFHTEQESNGRRLEQQGAGMMLLSAVEGAVIQEKPWFGSCFSYMVFPKTSLSPSILRSSIKRLLEDPVYAQKADHLRATASSYPGASLAADLVEDISKTFSPSTKGWDRLSWRQKLGLSFPSF
jgi:UDP:flavonoid glycosyltransferase YjiC (YdhE family)